MADSTLSRIGVAYIGLLEQQRFAQPQVQRQRLMNERFAEHSLDLGSWVKSDTRPGLAVFGINDGFKVREEPLQTPHRPKTPEKDKQA